MSNRNVTDLTSRDSISDPITELLRDGARQLLQEAIEAELSDFLSQYQGVIPPLVTAFFSRGLRRHH